MNVGRLKKGDARTREGGYEALATAVIGQAISDYYDALTNTRMRNDPVKVEERRKLEQFFTSQIFVLFSEHDGECLMNEIRQEASQALGSKASEKKQKGLMLTLKDSRRENDYGTFRS